MNELQNKYGQRDGHCGFQIFGFPSNQFGYQEPAENFELLNCLKYVRPGYGFVPSFPLAAKGDVNGINEHSIYTFLKARCPTPFGLIANRSDITWSPLRNNDISWNFQKWLIKHDGQPFRRYTSRTTPQAIEEDINTLINECTNALMNKNAASSANTTAAAPAASNQAQQFASSQQQVVQRQQTLVNGKKKKRSLFDLFW